MLGAWCLVLGAGFAGKLSVRQHRTKHQALGTKHQALGTKHQALGTKHQPMAVLIRANALDFAGDLQVFHLAGDAAR